MSCSPGLQKKQMEFREAIRGLSILRREQSVDWQGKKLEEDGNLSLTPTLGFGFIRMCLCSITMVPILEAKKLKPRKGNHAHTLVKGEP